MTRSTTVISIPRAAISVARRTEFGVCIDLEFRQDGESIITQLPRSFSCWCYSNWECSGKGLILLSSSTSAVSLRMPSIDDKTHKSSCDSCGIKPLVNLELDAPFRGFKGFLVRPWLNNHHDRDALRAVSAESNHIPRNWTVAVQKSDEGKLQGKPPVLREFIFFWQVTASFPTYVALYTDKGMFCLLPMVTRCTAQLAIECQCLTL